MRTVKDYCSDLGWSVSELARQAGLSWQAADNAFKGEEVQPRTKRDICSALSIALNKIIRVGDIQWKETGD